MYTLIIANFTLLAKLLLLIKQIINFINYLSRFSNSLLLLN